MATVYAGTAARARPRLTGLQPPPPFVLLNSPSSVPAYRVAGALRSMARALTWVLGRPVLADFHSLPAGVPLHTTAGREGKSANTGLPKTPVKALAKIGRAHV